VRSELRVAVATTLADEPGLRTPGSSYYADLPTLPIAQEKQWLFGGSSPVTVAGAVPDSHRTSLAT